MRRDLVNSAYIFLCAISLGGVHLLINEQVPFSLVNCQLYIVSECSPFSFRIVSSLGVMPAVVSDSLDRKRHAAESVARRNAAIPSIGTCVSGSLGCIWYLLSRKSKRLLAPRMWTAVTVGLRLVVTAPDQVFSSSGGLDISSQP